MIGTVVPCWAAFLRRLTAGQGRSTLPVSPPRFEPGEQRLRAVPISALAVELHVPGECRGRPACAGALYDPGGGEASSAGAVGLCSGRAAAFERGRGGPGVVPAGPMGSEPPGARADAPPGRVAAEGSAAAGRAQTAPCSPAQAVTPQTGPGPDLTPDDARRACSSLTSTRTSRK